MYDLTFLTKIHSYEQKKKKNLTVYSENDGWRMSGV